MQKHTHRSAYHIQTKSGENNYDNNSRNLDLKPPVIVPKAANRSVLAQTNVDIKERLIFLSQMGMDPLSQTQVVTKWVNAFSTHFHAV